MDFWNMGRRDPSISSHGPQILLYDPALSSLPSSAAWMQRVQGPRGAWVLKSPHRGPTPNACGELLREQEINFYCEKPLNSGGCLLQQLAYTMQTDCVFIWSSERFMLRLCLWLDWVSLLSTLNQAEWLDIPSGSISWVNEWTYQLWRSTVVL